MNNVNIIYGLYDNNIIKVTKFGIKYYQRYQENELDFYARVKADFLKNFKSQLKINKIES